MDDFRVGSIPQYDRLVEQQQQDPRKRRNPKDHHPPAEEEDEVVLGANDAQPEDPPAGYGYGTGERH
jgi:hypothetical protein